MKLVKLLLISLLVIGQPQGASFEGEPPLMVWLDFKHAESQRAALIRYRNILEKAFQRPVVYSHIEQASTEIRLIDRRFNKNDPSWRVGQYLIDEVPGFSLIKKPEELTRNPPLIGVIRRPYMIPYERTQYNIDSMNVAYTMLKNRRLDIILDYSRESGYYTQLDSGLVIEELSHPKKVRVLFRETATAESFNLAMSRLAGMKKNTDDSDEITIDEQQKLAFKWYLIAKQLDHNSNEHVATDADIKIGLWLESQLKDYFINTDLASVSDIKDKLTSTDNVCIVNTEVQQDPGIQALYSTPTYIFLDKRLYSYQDSPADHLANNWFNRKGNELFDLNAFAMDIPTSIFAYYEQSVGADVIAHAYREFIAAYPHRFIKIKPDAIGRSIELLNHSRIDYLIAQPFELKQIKQWFVSIPPMSSYTLKHFDNPVAQRFACTNNKAGQLLIGRINQLMSEQESRYALKELVIEEMLPNDKAAFVEAFDEVYMQFLTKHH